MAIKPSLQKNLVRFGLLFYVIVALVLATKTYTAWSLSKKIENESIKTMTVKKQLQPNKPFDVSFYKNAVLAYAKVHSLKRLEFSATTSEYAGAMKITLKWEALKRDDFVRALNAFSNLGYISHANSSGVTLHVVNFTKSDALRQLQRAS